MDASERKVMWPMPRASASPSRGFFRYSPFFQSGSLQMAQRAMAFMAMACADGRGDVARTIDEAILSGNWVAHSSACIPPHAPSHDRQQFIDTEVVQQKGVRPHHVSD